MYSYMISYDLNSPGQNYEKLHAEIKNQGAWWHYLDSTWIVNSKKSAAEIRDSLVQHLDSNDNILVVKLQGTWASKFNQKANKWLKNNLIWIEEK